MAKEWCVMGKQPRYNGGYEKEEFVYYAQDGFKEMLETTFLSDPIIFCKGIFNGDTRKFEVEVEIPAIVQQIQGDTELNTETAQILTEIGTINDYEYIKHRDEIWIITSEQHHNKIYEKSVIKLCKDTLKFQDTYGNVNYLPFWCEDSSKYSNGLKDGKVIIELEKKYNIKVAYNNISSTLKEGYRFMIEMIGNVPSVYKISKFDGISNKYNHIHVLNLTLTSDLYNPNTDNIDKWLCDYTENSTPNVPDTPTSEVQYYCDITYKNDSLLRVNSKKKFTASVYKMVKDETNSLADENGYVRYDLDLMTGLNVVWLLQGDVSDKLIMTIASDNSYITLQTDDEALIGEMFNIVLRVDGTDGETSFSYVEHTQEVEIVSLYS